MKTYLKPILLFTIIAAMFACNQTRKEDLTKDLNENRTAQSYKSEKSVQDRTSDKKILSTIAAKENSNKDGRKFIRTADIKFRSKDVVNTTYSIEDIINRFNGFVEFTNLESDIDNKSVVQISADSSLETTSYSVKNIMTIRVPNTNLDTALKSISALVDYMDYRVIKADDAALSILSNEMEQERVKKYGKRIENSIDNKGRRLTDIMEAEDGNEALKETSDEAKLANIKLMDKVKFSTVNLTIYQKQAVTKEIIAAYKPVKPFEPTFEDQIISSLMFGLDILKSILIFIAKFWTFALLGISIFYLNRILRKKSIVG